MRGAAAPVSFSLNLPSALPEQTRSPGANALSRRERACELQKGRDSSVVQRVGRRGCGLAQLEVRPTWRCCRFWFRRQAALPNTWDWTWPGRSPHFVSRLRLVGTVRIYFGAAESLLSLREAPFTVAFVRAAHGLGRPSPRTPRVPTGVKKRSRVGGLISVPSVSRCDRWGCFDQCGCARTRSDSTFVAVACRSASVRHGAWTASYGFWTVDNVHDNNGRQC